ncbi:MAG TPA: hypothetical protein VJO53_12725 [Candidatus Acidoferrales bacterium]|nr:hypothetical protein [Candidatus Acidoferrales bacterium]
MRNEVNADLWRANRRRWRISSALLALGAVVALILACSWPPRSVENALMTIAIIFYVAGMIGMRWAGREYYFLSRPEPKERPKLWKFPE